MPLSRQRLWQIANVGKGRCEICAATRVTARHCEKHRLAHQRRKNKRLNTEKWRAYFRDRARDYYYTHKIESAAKGAVREAIRKGLLVRGPCAICGEKRTDAHHSDYSRPLDVTWLCRPHHKRLHYHLRGSTGASAQHAAHTP